VYTKLKIVFTAVTVVQFTMYSGFPQVLNNPEFIFQALKSPCTLAMQSWRSLMWPLKTKYWLSNFC